MEGQVDLKDFNFIPVSIAEEMNPKWRPNHEDVHSVFRPGEWACTVPNLTFIGVYDGHGGRDMVDFIKHAMPFHLAQELDPKMDEIKKRVTRAFLMVDIHARQVEIMSSGAVVAVCLIQRNPLLPSRFRVVTANVGDARIVAGVETTQTDEKGNPIVYVERLTFDHQASTPEEIKRIYKSGGFCYKRRVAGVLAPSRALGDQAFKDFVLGEPFVRETILDFKRNSTTKRAFLIIACDGLWDVMSDRTAAERVAKWTGPPEKVAEDLIQFALKRGTRDNVTVIVAWLWPLP